MKTAYDKIAAGLQDAIAYASGEEGRGHVGAHRWADDDRAVSTTATPSACLPQPAATERDLGPPA